jgi:hypothetical protein
VESADGTGIEASDSVVRIVAGEKDWTTKLQVPGTKFRGHHTQLPLGEDRSRPEELVAGEAPDKTLEFQDAQCGQHLRSGQTGADDQLVDFGGLAFEVTEERSLLIGEGQLRGVADGGLVGSGMYLADQGPECLEDVVDRLDQPRAVADQPMAVAA